MSIHVRLAHSDDVDLIVGWRRAATRWLTEQGSDQWSADSTLPPQVFHDRVHRAVDAGTTWIAELDGRPVGTITVDQLADRGLWTDAELAEALVIHRMIVDRAASGRGVGDALLDQADQAARDHDRPLLRLDAWTTNTRLHDYYRAKGFRLTRVLDTNFPSAALFERPVPPAPPTPRRADAPSGEAATQRPPSDQPQVDNAESSATTAGNTP